MAIVTLSSKGQIVLPREVREALGMREGDRFVVTLEGDRVILTRLPSSIGSDWRYWRGRLAGSGALQAHIAEHADEVRRDECLP
ncbi:AbrB/MazE/SpoVT family DNA-binding domain-containing protein [Thermoflexus sp.]|uniref:AbrB/MazE/SpoVT family DNA-binding domain-containing protein n=1 Tax=Thermoflexus sp. TaxID=1969742 RepID=UPI0035E428B9